MKKLFSSEEAGLELASLTTDPIVERRNYSVHLPEFPKVTDEQPTARKDLALELAGDVYRFDVISSLSKMAGKVKESAVYLMMLTNRRLEKWYEETGKRLADAKASLLAVFKDKEESRRRTLRYSAGLTIVETLIAIVLGLLLVGIAFFVYNKGKAAEEQSAIQQTIGTLFGAIDTAKSDNGGAYPSGTIPDLGSFPVTGDHAHILLGGALCPSASNGTCLVPQMSQWSYGCSSTGGPGTVTVSIVVPNSEVNVLGAMQNSIQQTYPGWQCPSTSSNTLSCSIVNVICQ